MNEISLQNNKPDSLGIILSFTCLIHCLGVPLLAYFAPSISVFFEQEWIHKLVLSLLFLIALFAFGNGYKKHKMKSPLVYAVIAISFLIIAMFFEEFSSLPLEKILTLIGSSVMVFAHIKNIKLINKTNKVMNNASYN